ncbi:MAG TPA: RNA 3'-terminal phosphate cyclase [Candidatus Acidoferrum sp.]|nr:RNA 3'-terminal phosphate cyclase [Candidatus Acidoferrum sp.]
MIEIDGSFGEGGGQVLRTTVGLSALLEKGVHVKNIRGKRPNPGLRAQHMTAIKAVAAVSDAETKGLEIGSTDLYFTPRKKKPGSFKFDVGTAGSISLVLQALMPASAFSSGRTEFKITGGTDVRWSPTIDYVRFVVLPNLSKLGYLAELKLIQRGHYPKGGGSVSMMIQPCKGLMPLKLTERSEIKRVRGISHCVRLPVHVAQRQAAAAQEILKNIDQLDISITLETYPPATDPHIAPGSGIALYTDNEPGKVLGADNVGERGRPAEEVGRQAASQLGGEINSGAPVDRHMSDILIPYLAVAKGNSEFRTSLITMHAITNARIAELVSGAKITVDGELGNPGIVRVEGIGLAP